MAAIRHRLPPRIGGRVRKPICHGGNMNKRLGLAVSIITLLAVAGCASSTTATTTGNTPGVVVRSSAPPGGMAQPFGADCPSDAAAMANEPVATAVADNPA